MAIKRLAFSGDSIAVSSTGTYTYAAYSSNGTSYLYESTNMGAWTDLTPYGVAGVNPQLAFGGAAVEMVTQASTSVTVSTFYTSGVSAASDTVSVTPAYTAAAWYPTAAMGNEAIFVTTPSGQVDLLQSTDGGHTFSTSQAANYSSSSPNGSAVATVGTTRLATLAGYPGQLTAAVQGSTLFVEFTTELDGQTVAAVVTSPNDGGSWTAPQTVALTNTSVVNPMVVSSEPGYLYGTWLENSRGGWTVDAVEFSADGRLLAGPSPLPGATLGAVSPTAYTALVIDAFARPFYAWSVPIPNLPPPWLAASALAS